MSDTETKSDKAPRSDAAGDAKAIDTRGTRRTIQGTVTSTNMDKTVVVTVVRRVRDRRFHKFLTNRIRYKAHDEQNSCKVGDLIEIVESRPMSRTKRWRFVRLITRPEAAS